MGLEMLLEEKDAISFGRTLGSSVSLFPFGVNGYYFKESSKEFAYMKTVNETDGTKGFVPIGGDELVNSVEIS